MQSSYLAILLILTAVPPLAAQAAYGEQQETLQLTISSQLENGDVVQGKFTELVSGQTTISTGFTPATFTLNNGEEYRVGVADYLSYTFSYWLDTGSADRWRTVEITEDTHLVAVYALEEEASALAAEQNPETFVKFEYIQELIDAFAVYEGDSAKVPEINLRGYIMPDGSEVLDYGCLYELIRFGMSVNNVVRAAEYSGLDWYSLTEEQQCYLVVVMNLGIPLDDDGLPL